MLYECEFCGTLRHQAFMERTYDDVWFCDKCRPLVRRRAQVLTVERMRKAEDWEESNLVTKLLRLLHSMEQM